LLKNEMIVGREVYPEPVEGSPVRATKLLDLVFLLAFF